MNERREKKWGEERGRTAEKEGESDEPHKF